MRDYLQFLDVCEVEGEYYFSYLGFNGLFKGSLNGRTAEFVSTFPEERKDQTFLHRRVVKIENSLFFIPYRGRGIAEYNIREKKHTFYEIPCKGDIVSFSQAHLRGRDILLIPVNDKVDFAIFHYDKKEIEYIPEIWEKIKKVVPGEVLFDVASSVLHSNQIVVTVWNSNIVLKIDLGIREVTAYKIGDDYSFRNLNNFNGRYWITQLYRNTIVSCDETFGDTKEYECKEMECVEHPIFNVVKLGNGIVALPAEATAFWRFNASGAYFEKLQLKFPDDCWDSDIQGLRFIGNFVNSYNELVLFPKRSKFLLVISKDMKSITPHKIAIDNYEVIRNKVAAECIEDEISDRGILQEGTAEMISLTGFISFVKKHNSDSNSIGQKQVGEKIWKTLMK